MGRRTGTPRTVKHAAQKSQVRRLIGSLPDATRTWRGFRPQLWVTVTTKVKATTSLSVPSYPPPSRRISCNFPYER